MVNWVDSRSGKGSTFHFTADLINGYCPFITSDDLDPNSFDEVYTLEKLKGLSILIAEDDLINRKVMESLLVNVGCTVEISSNGLDVMKKMENPCYDVILMDVSMPEVDGYEATKKLERICCIVLLIYRLLLYRHMMPWMLRKSALRLEWMDLFQNL